MPIVTLAAFVKVFDGLVLATDSATTLNANGSYQVYNGADKIFQLHRRKPVGAMTWGLGSIGGASIATLAKDLRMRLMGKDPNHKEWELGEDYTVEQVSNRVTEMFHELYAADFGAHPGPLPVLGLLIGGYSSASKKSEAWVISIEDPKVRPEPMLVAGPDAAGWQAYAQPEPTGRLFNGIDPVMLPALASLVPSERADDLSRLLEQQQRQPVIPPMPLPDAIALARYLVDVTVGYRHFLVGPDTVGGQVEVAAISRHEGFKWVSRKHYYPAELNREEPSHA